MRLNGHGLLEPIQATPVTKNDKLYYNIFHGSPQVWEFRCSVDARLACVKVDKKLCLKEDHFIFREITNDGEVILKDKLGNIYYVISKDSNEHHKKDVVIFWDIKDDLTNIIFKTDGFVKVLGHGFNGTAENPIPAPILEIYGDASFHYEGLDENKKIKKVSYQFTHNSGVLKRI